ncbi:biliverdin-producing heme oxygenase [Paenibacillus sp. 598K]|uniref:biliverdin-producing heme oxygenase n=1 Tax=Paenibacillus sp. 598K TaxID=1117987 RepID=UPI000FF91FD3|nr:biliverdin-producing heme oxygenase [Paenibacillus sp. 598K]GBF72916.1 biliverdin-producing heme oxygenase [Paenibacillus sp. 598K]
MSTASTVLTRLRDETAPMHQKIEANEYAAAMMNNRLTMALYKEYLAKFYGFIKPLEQRMRELDEAGVSALSDPSRDKTAWLVRDLTALGLSSEEIGELPQCDRLPELATRAQALGALYVLEGSTLGGQMITKKLAQYLPIDTTVNGHYFNSYGAQTRERWQSFRQELLAEADSETKEVEMIEAARQTFTLLDEWIASSNERQAEERA